MGDYEELSEAMGSGPGRAASATADDELMAELDELIGEARDAPAASRGLKRPAHGLGLLQIDGGRGREVALQTWSGRRCPGR